MTTPLSKFLFQVQGVADADDRDRFVDARALAIDCEEHGHTYPDAVWQAANDAEDLLRKAAPEVIAEIGTLPDRNE